MALQKCAATSSGPLSFHLFQLVAQFTSVVTFNWFHSFSSRTAVPTLGELLSPAFQQGVVVVTETGLFGTAKDATQIITVTNWGLPRRPTSIRPPLHPSTLGNVVPRNLSAPWRPWLGNSFIRNLPWKHCLCFEPPCSHWDVQIYLFIFILKIIYLFIIYFWLPWSLLLHAGFL